MENFERIPVEEVIEAFSKRIDLTLTKCPYPQDYDVLHKPYISFFKYIKFTIASACNVKRRKCAVTFTQFFNICRISLGEIIINLEEIQNILTSDGFAVAIEREKSRMTVIW
jgi:hypothetical protein